MKNAIRLAAATALISLLASGCYLILDPGIGSVGIEIPPPSSSGAAGPEAARIFIVNGSVLIQVGGAEFTEVALTGAENEVTVGPIPSGPGYQVVLALGGYVTGFGGEEYFVPSEYAVSEVFNVYAGQATIAELSPESSPFSAPPTAFLGRSLVGVAAFGANIFTATANQVFQLDAGLSIVNNPMMPGGETVNSIDRGAIAGDGNYVWLNTSKGIIPYNGGAAFDPTIDGLGFDAAVSLKPVLDSGAYDLAGDLYGYFQFDGGLGGVYDGGGGVEWLSEIDLSAYVVGQPVYDVTVDAALGFGYFATKLGAFRMPQNVLSDLTIDTAQEVFNASQFFSVTIDGIPAPIIQIGVDATTLYLGTPRGVVTVSNAVVGQQGLTAGAIIPETLNRNIKEILIGTSYHAFLTNNFIVVGTDPGGGMQYESVPLGASSVGTPTGLFLDDAGGVVLIVGSGGLVALDIDSVIP